MDHLRNDFPLFKFDKSLIYFDNAATTQKPQIVIDALVDVYARHNANVGRGVYALSEQATKAYENARAIVAAFIGAHAHEIVFTRNTTESINLVACTWARHNLGADDEILITELEHHSNILPWQLIARAAGARLVVLPVTDQGQLRLDLLDTLVTPKTKLIAITHVSNALGSHTDVARIKQAAARVGARMLIDAAQSIAHQQISVVDLGCDFLAFSGHKLLGPTGIGVLYINEKLHDGFPPYQVGGGMIYEADFTHATFLPLPHRLEAGTPSIAQAIALGVAITYIKDHIDFTHLRAHEAALCTQLIEGLQNLAGVTILGPVEELKERGHLVSFSVAGIHPHDVAAYLDTKGICVRAGHHCAQPLAKRLGLDASVRVSFYAYNTPGEVQKLLEALEGLLRSS
ncbi:MAG: aminotransferase class V-fold PLP-dependent enzyme [Candidatus Babeliales bacterium]